MSTQSWFEQVKEVVAGALEVSPDQITVDLAYGDIPEWDSMGHMNVMMAMEDRFGVEITTENIAQLTSLPILCAYLAEREHD